MSDYKLSIKVPCPNCGHEVPITLTEKIQTSTGLADKVARELQRLDDDPPAESGDES